MLLSAPIYRLKRQARLLSRQIAIPLHKALDEVAKKEGYQNWSHLASTSSTRRPARIILSKLEPGDFVLLGARPGNGKTLLGIELASSAADIDRKGFFFTLEYNKRDIFSCLHTIGIEQNSIVVDTSDEISADYIISRLEQNKKPAFFVIDYLQLLDQKRTSSSLKEQIHLLRQFLKNTGAICIVISQIDRSFELSEKSIPDKSDLRLPNPVDLSAFDKFCFLHDGVVQMDQAA